MNKTFDVEFSKVLKTGGGSGGTTDHAQLSNRDLADQHPIEAISGLREELDGVQDVVVETLIDFGLVSVIQDADGYSLVDEDGAFILNM